MKALLDTHTFLWWAVDDARLSGRVREIISEGRNKIYVSAASMWEIAIKARLGRLDAPGDLEGFIAVQMNTNAFDALDIRASHALHTYRLPLLHRDPFDRMLVAQSQLEGLPILTTDAQIGAYGVEVVWE